MKKIILSILVSISMNAGAQTLISLKQIRVTTNEFSVAGAQTTNLYSMIAWMNTNWHSQAGYASNSILVTTSNALSDSIEAVSNALVYVEKGTCTNGQSVSFTGSFTETPAIVGTWIGPVTTNASGAYPVLYLQAASASGFTMQSTIAQTNSIYWISTGVTGAQ